ncbi:MAG: hypothetical protein HN523_06385 [Porticoccaceae bacterium]|jgi:hypothetical protein|nr:hypothetical protein [Porticoccaceae bacterium]
MDLAEETGATILIVKPDRISRRVSFISAIMECKNSQDANQPIELKSIFKVREILQQY